jgi:hypothetical protein
MSDLACRRRFSMRKAISWFRQAQHDKVFIDALKKQRVDSRNSRY